MSLPEEILAERRIVALVGAGGVGKTTLAAALALGAARRGRRALVLTIDPARRLADALGTGPLGNEPRRIDPALLAPLGVPEGGALHAMMLDRKGTFDALVNRLAPDPAARARIFDNPIYQHVSDALAGSDEYSAMEKVYEMAQREDFDVIVLDTPPSQHALDFLEAPERLLGLLEGSVLQKLVHPALSAGRFGLRIFGRGAHQVFQLVERVTGLSFLEDVSEFLLAFEAMADGFRARAREVQELLFGDQAGFVLACGASRESVSHARAFLGRLDEHGAPVVGLVANRLRCWPGAAPTLPETPEERAHLQAVLTDALAAGPGAYPAESAAQAALALADGYAADVARDASATAPFLGEIGRRGAFARCVPEFSGDVHDLESLARVERHLFERSEAEATENGA
jgi:anion-transporting  ArsA/GET3 family ATPase